MNFDEISPIINELLQLPHSFAFDDVSNRFSIDDADFPEVCKAIENDHNFIFTIDNDVYRKRFIAKNSIYNWFVNLNLKLAISKVFTLEESQLLSQMNSLCLCSSWKSIPGEYINFGQNLGLVHRSNKQNKYNFPLSYAISFFSLSSIQSAKEYLFSRTYNEDITHEYERLILARLQEVLSHLSDRQRYVIIKRQGILGSNKMKLEEIGHQLQITRERIRQIEKKSWKRIWHNLFQPRFTPLLLIYILNRKGSLLVYSPNIQQEIEFICKCLNVPLWIFPYVNIPNIGENNNISLPENIWVDLSNLEINISNFLSNLSLQLIQDDVEKLTKLLAPIVTKRLTKSQKVYLALKQIGRPAHFSEITDMYIDMFLGEHPTEHSIHAILLREQNGIVWIGSKGKFALEEWGYERPSLSIHDAVAEIVIKKYAATGNPVRINVIQAEIGKYRKYINPNSIISAAYYNSKLNNVYNDYFIPKDTGSERYEAGDNRLDRILRQFERKKNIN